jgi:hydroxyquinol 1,2-dioxygenase
MRGFSVARLGGLALANQRFSALSTPDGSESFLQAKVFFCAKRESDPLEVSGQVTDSKGRPIANALVEVWQTAPNQLYDVQDESQPERHLRGSFRTDSAGTFRSIPFPMTVLPASYSRRMGRHPFRPAHIHFMISAPGYRTLVTHLFLEGDEYLGSDVVFGVKPCLIIRPKLIDGVNTVAYTFGLADEREPARLQIEERRRS